MENSNIIKKLQCIASFRIVGSGMNWKFYREYLFNLVQDNMDLIKIDDFNWKGSSYNKPKDLKLYLFNFDNWSTYNKRWGSFFNYNYKDGTIDITINVENGNNYDGTYESNRWSLTFNLPLNKINFDNKDIDYTINKSFKFYLEDSYENYLDQQKLDWIENHKNQLLKD